MPPQAAIAQPAVTRVRLTCFAPGAHRVFVAGTYNDWDTTATPLEHEAGGLWETFLELPPGHHEYKFLVDGAWTCEPGCGDPAASGPCNRCVRNRFGTVNRVIDVT